MADISTIATLGLELDASGAQASATQFGQTLDQLGTKGQAATQQLTAAQQTLVSEMQRVQAAALLVDAANSRAITAYLQQVQAVQQLATQMNQLALVEVGLGEATQTVLKNQLAAADYATRLGAARRQLAADTRAQAAAEVQAAAASSTAASSFNLAGAGVGRLRQGFISLIAQTTGTLPVLDRTLGTLASVAVGSLAVTGVVGGLALIALAYDRLSASSRETAKAVEEAITALEKQQHIRALGPGGEDVDRVQKLQDQITADSATIAQLQAERYSPTTIAGLMPGAGGAQIGLDEKAAAIQKEIDRYRIAIGQASEEIHKIESQFIVNLAHQQIDQQAALIRANQASPAERATAQALVNDFKTQLEYLQKAHPEQLGLRTMLTESLDTLQTALNPPKAISQAAHADDTVTKFADELRQLRADADAFGRDDSIGIRMQAFTDRINQAETALRRLHQANTAPQIAALEAIKAQIPGVGADLQQHVQAEFDTQSDARLTKLRESTAMQLALNAAQLDGVDAVNQLKAAQAGQLAVEAEMARINKAGVGFMIQHIQDVRQAAIDAETAKNGPKDQGQALLQPLTAISNEAERYKANLQIQNVFRGIGGQAPLDITGGMKQYQDTAVSAARAITTSVLTSNLSWVDQAKLLQQINAMLREMGLEGKASVDSITTSLKDTSGAFHQGADVITATGHKGDAGLSALLNTIGNLVGNVGAVRTAANTPDKAGLTPGLLSLASIVPDVAVISSVVAIATELFGTSQVAQEWKSVLSANNAALANLTLKLNGFQVNVSNTLAASQGIGAFEANPAAVGALTANATHKGGLFSGDFSNVAGGDLQSQINALGPYLQQIFGAGTNIVTDWQQLDAIAKQYGLTLTDTQGRIIPAALASLTTALQTAAQAAFTLANNWTNNSTLGTMLGKAQGQTTIQDQWSQLVAAFQKTAPNAGEPTGIPTSLAGENAWRTWIVGILKQEQSQGTAFNYAQYGNFTSIQDFNNAINTLLDPLNQLTNTVNGVVDSLTNVPTGSKVAYDRYESTFAAAYGSAPTSTARPTMLQTTQMPVTNNLTVNITSNALTGRALVDEVGLEFQKLTARGGTSRLGLLTPHSST